MCGVTAIHCNMNFFIVSVPILPAGTSGNLSHDKFDSRNEAAADASLQGKTKNLLNIWSPEPFLSMYLWTYI